MIIKLSQCLGLTAQEIAALDVQRVASLDRQYGKTDCLFTLNKILTTPNGSLIKTHKEGRAKAQYKRKSVTFSLEEFNKVVHEIIAMTKAGQDIEPEYFYPIKIPHSASGRDLPIVDKSLVEALQSYLKLRLIQEPHLKPTDWLIVTQKGGPYSPNTLQEHMALMFGEWAGIEKGRSSSGRRYLLNDILNSKKKSISVAQKIAGHQSVSTTARYAEQTYEHIQKQKPKKN